MDQDDRGATSPSAARPTSGSTAGRRWIGVLVGMLAVLLLAEAAVRVIEPRLPEPADWFSPSAARLVREMVPRAHFATVYAKPAGRPYVDTCVKEFKQNKWIYFPWDTGLAVQPPIREGGD